MHVQFLPEPPVPQSGTAWIENGLTLRYGPFQPVEAPLPANAAEQGAFECDSVLWNLWVEFHQTMRPDFSFPPLESTPTPRLVKHLSDSMTRCLAFHDFWRRLTGHLDLTGVIALPRNASFSEQWVFVSTSLRDQWPSPAMDGAMHQRKLWMCMIYELTLFHFNLKTRQAELNGLFIGNISHFFQSLGHKVKDGIQSLLSSLPALSPAPDESFHEDSPEFGRADILRESDQLSIRTGGCELRSPNSVVHQRAGYSHHQ